MAGSSLAAFFASFSDMGVARMLRDQGLHRPENGLGISHSLKVILFCCCYRGVLSWLWEILACVVEGISVGANSWHLPFHDRVRICG